MEFTQSGDVLAGRYQLTDLLSESREGRFWRAQDAVLGRPVAVHVLDARDERAPRLMAAARNSAAVGDPRMLRVLDAAQTDQVAYVVNEWGEGASLENALAAGGPLPPQQAAWIASEVADLLVLAHDQGHAHGRLNPEAVLLDDLGAVRVIGFGVDAALHGIDPDTRDSQRRDRVDAVGVLYAALTGKWAGETLSSMPPAPRDHGRVLRPRQVRAGVPRPLDDLCDRVLGSGADMPPLTAAELHSALAGFSGEPTAPLNRPSAIDEDTQAMAPPTELEPAEAQAASNAIGVAPDAVRPQRQRPASPPPMQDPTPSKPLFADETPGYTPPPPRPQQAPPAARRPVAPDASYNGWQGPWTGANVPIAEEPDYNQKPGANWLRIAMGVALVVLVLIAGSIAWNIISDDPNTTAENPGTGSNEGNDGGQAAEPTVIKGITAKDLDPHGEPPTETPDLVDLVVDGDVNGLAWRTARYNDQIGDRPRSLKPGVGLVLNLKGDYSIDSVKFNMIGEPTDIEIYVGDSPWSDDPSGTPAAKGSVGTEGEIKVEDAPEGSYVLVWMTGLPEVDGGYRAEVKEVQVLGTPVS
ncbi:protein kinase family protein [Nocardioides sp. NPDC057767]|uniref:protein kinase family protein n=1 Tax=unclassified Nocardioides TaxID=2615069 RepID=UPI0036720FE2